MRDRELILRFLALYFDTNNYKRPMTEFLNDYMGKNRHLKLQSLKEVKVTFENAIQIVFEHIGSTAFKPRRTLNAAVFDAAMHGIAKRLQKSSIKDGNSLKTLYRSLLEDETFTLACQKATADEENVKTRLRLATEAFSKVK